MTEDKKDAIILLGAGLAGSMMAVYLAQRGFQVEVYERRPDMRRMDISAGKSINLALSVRGLHALRGIGMEEEILELCIPMRGRMIHPVEGELDFQPYSKDGQTAINSVSRGELNKRLMERADSHDSVNFHFNWRCLGFDPRTGEARFHNEETGERKAVKGKTIIAADGAFSGGRNGLLRTPRVDFSQEFLRHGYKELEIPPAPGGGWLMDKHSLHIWPRGEYMLIALPNLDGSFTVTLFFPYKGNPSFETLHSPEAVQDFFREVFPDALELMPNLGTDFFENPTGDLVTIRCSPWSFKDKFTLVGDAAHAVVPFYGQGMNAAFEDCAVLDTCIEEYGDDWEWILDAYQERRIANGNAIADMALENYVEMRDLTGDPEWRKRKDLEHRLEKEFPQRYISRYEMVSFSRIPYAEAYRRGEQNNIVLDKLTERGQSAESLDLELADSLIKEHLK